MSSKPNESLATPTDLAAEASVEIAAALNPLLADIFALYLKTKNFHWHASGPHFRDYHLLLDEQADQLFQYRKLRMEGIFRLSSPLLYLAFASIALAMLLGGEFNRRGQFKRIFFAY